MSDNSLSDLFPDELGNESENEYDASLVDLDLDALLAELNISQYENQEEPEVLPPPKNASQQEKKELLLPKTQPSIPIPPISDSFEEEMPEEEGGVLDSVAKHRRGINTFLIITALVLVGAIAFMFLNQGNADPFGGKILQNVSIAGVDVSGMTKAEASRAVKAEVGTRYSDTDMVVVLGKKELHLAPGSTNANFNIDAAVKAAYEYGRDGSISDRQKAVRDAQDSQKDISLLNYLGLDTGYIRSTLKNAISEIGGEYAPSEYHLSGEEPALDADGFMESVHPQTLILNLGMPGSNADIEAIFNAVMNAYSRGEFRIVVGDESLPDFPDTLDLNKIYSEICSSPVEATATTAGSVGYQFNITEAQSKLSNADFGDEIEISMEYVMPHQLQVPGEYPETLGMYSTPLFNDPAYIKNIQLICDAINGTVIEPNDIFEFNKVVPARTEANGFQSAPDHAQYCVDTSVGGGQDQVATTIYVSALKADLGVVERYTADHVCPYTIRGTEVAVGLKWQNLKIRNTTDQPIEIRAKVTSNQLIIRFMAKAVPEYYTEVESVEGHTSPYNTVRVQMKESEGYTNDQVLLEGVNGGSVQLFRVQHNRTTGEEISRKSEAFIDLKSINQRIVTLVK